MVFGVTDYREQLCHKVKARAVLRQEQEEEEVEEGLVLETPLLMSEGEGLLLQEEGISFIGGSKGVLCQGGGEAEEVWDALKCLVGKHAVPRRAEVRVLHCIIFLCQGEKDNVEIVFLCQGERGNKEKGRQLEADHC